MILKILKFFKFKHFKETEKIKNIFVYKNLILIEKIKNYNICLYDNNNFDKINLKYWRNTDKSELFLSFRKNYLILCFLKENKNIIYDIKTFKIIKIMELKINDFISNFESLNNYFWVEINHKYSYFFVKKTLEKINLFNLKNDQTINYLIVLGNILIGNLNQNDFIIININNFKKLELNLYLNIDNIFTYKNLLFLSINNVYKTENLEQINIFKIKNHYFDEIKEYKKCIHLSDGYKNLFYDKKTFKRINFYFNSNYKIKLQEYDNIIIFNLNKKNKNRKLIIEKKSLKQIKFLGLNSNENIKNIFENKYFIIILNKNNYPYFYKNKYFENKLKKINY